MPFRPDLNYIKSLTAEKRGDLLQNAVRLDEQDIVDLIIGSGLPTKEGGGLCREDPRILKIKELAYSEEGMSAAEQAVREGIPPLAGVDRIIFRELGKAYGEFDTTDWSGTYVAEMMRSKGYADAGKNKALPKDCIARTGLMFFEKTLK
jgi:hypothetical protein